MKGQRTYLILFSQRAADGEALLATASILKYTTRRRLVFGVVHFMDQLNKQQGSRFFVGRKGATLGRRQTNTIAFSHESGGTVMGIDASISGEHARIVYDEDGDFLHIMDGTPTKVRPPS